MVARRNRKALGGMLDLERAETIKQLNESVEIARRLRKKLQSDVEDISNMIETTESLITQLTAHLAK